MHRTHVYNSKQENSKSCFPFSFLSSTTFKPVFVKPSVFPYLIAFARF